MLAAPRSTGDDKSALLARDVDNKDVDGLVDSAVLLTAELLEDVLEWDKGLNGERVGRGEGFGVKRVLKDEVDAGNET